MTKYFLASIAILSLLPMAVLAVPAFNEVTFTQDTNLYVWGLDVTVVAKANSVVAGITVNSGNISLVLKSGSDITLTTAPSRYLANSVADTVCGSIDESSVHIISSIDQTVTVTPGGSCFVNYGSSGGSGNTGGGGGSTPATTVAMPATVTGEVTASAAGGGKTTLTTTEGTKATVEIPANTITTDAVVKAVSVTPATVATTAPAPTGMNMVSAFSFVATAAGASVSSFSKPVILTLTYTDSQIAGLNESSLQVYHWSGTQWVALTGTVNTVTNTITATTNSFSYFAIMGTLASATTPTTTTKLVSQMTVAELQTEIARITALIVNLQAELAKLTGTAQSFVANLYQGLKSNAEVKRLQEFLISKGYLGAGFNTGNYLSLTVAAVKAYQTAKAITPVSGYFGPLTRAAVNADIGTTQ